VPETFRWDSEKNDLLILDQKALPSNVRYIRCRNYEDIARCIEDMSVRGAPAIGIAASYGIAMASAAGVDSVISAAARLASTRPTAVNLFWAIQRMVRSAEFVTDGSELFKTLLQEADLILEEDIRSNVAIGKNGASLLPEKCRVLSHCNAGSFATGGHGTALGVIRSARASGKEIQVFLDETRPVLQGSRLSALELVMDGFDVTVICDSMAGFLMKEGKVDVVIVGADRVARNGDFANKIGTYSLAVLAKEHFIPFYVAAPSSTFDPDLGSGDDIRIEERSGEEIRSLPGGQRIPDNIKVWNPSFDVTPAPLVSAYISEKGVFRFPYRF
jgi:methylthioribose-1-phosphate isomerase